MRLKSLRVFHVPSVERVLKRVDGILHNAVVVLVAPLSCLGVDKEHYRILLKWFFNDAHADRFLCDTQEAFFAIVDLPFNMTARFSRGNNVFADRTGLFESDEFGA